MTLLQTLLFSIVEGITEFLPISSTGHLILTARLLRLPASETQKTFEVVIQLGAILAVTILYAQRLTAWSAWRPVVLAFIPTGIVGLLLHRLVKTYLLGNVVVVIVSLFIGGVIFLAVEYWLGRRKTLPTTLIHHVQELTGKQAMILGFCQALALLPGVSRSGAVMIGGLLLGMSRVAAVDFSFMLAIPTMLVATGFDLAKSYQLFTGSDWLQLLVGFSGAFGAAWIVVKWFLRYVQQHSLVAFGVYRILLSVLWVVLIGIA